MLLMGRQTSIRTYFEIVEIVEIALFTSLTADMKCDSTTSLLEHLIISSSGNF